MNKKLNDKLKYKSLRDAYIHLIKLITHKDINQKIINKKLTHNEIMELIKEYYSVNKFKKPIISVQSISNLKNRELKLKPVERNDYTEDFVLFIKNKFNDFNIELFFSITEDNIEYKEKILLQKNDDKINDKLNYIYNYWLIIGIIGLLLICYDEDLSKEYLNFNNIKDIEPTIIEEFSEDHVDISKESSSKTWFSGEAADKINLKFITSIIFSFTLGACASTLVLYCLYTLPKDVIITQDPWTLTPNTLDKRQGLLIEKAILRNSILENIN